MSPTTHINKADCINKKGLKTVGTVGGKYNGSFISQCNWLSYSISFDYAALRQIQLINHSFKKNSVTEARSKIPHSRRVAWSFSSTHKYIWSRNVRKLSEKYCVLYFLFEIVVWIQAKNKDQQSVLPLFWANFAQTKPLFWLWIPEHALSSIFRFRVQLSFISKERGVFLCAVQTGRAHSQHW